MCSQSELQTVTGSVVKAAAELSGTVLTPETVKKKQKVLLYRYRNYYVR